MGKGTIYQSPHLLVGLNAFEPGQAHALHAHAGMDKVYFVLEGEGLFLLADAALPMRAGDLLVAPEGVPHGVENTARVVCSSWRSSHRRPCRGPGTCVTSGTQRPAAVCHRQCGTIGDP